MPITCSLFFFSLIKRQRKIKARTETNQRPVQFKTLLINNLKTIKFTIFTTDVNLPYKIGFVFFHVSLFVWFLMACSSLVFSLRVG